MLVGRRTETERLLYHLHTQLHKIQEVTYIIIIANVINKILFHWFQMAGKHLQVGLVRSTHVPATVLRAQFNLSPDIR